MIAVINSPVAAAATPEALGTAAQKFRSIIFYGGSLSAGVLTPNTQGAFIQLQELEADGDLGAWVDAIPVPAGEFSSAVYYEMNGSRVFKASEFKVRVAVNGEGVVAPVAL